MSTIAWDGHPFGTTIGTSARSRTSGISRTARSQARARASVVRLAVVPAPGRAWAAETQSPAETPGGAAAAESAPLRLTRRGRMLVLGTVAVLAAGAAFSAQSATAGAPQEAQAVVTRTVAPGETLWEVARDVAAPGQDLRVVVDDLIELNGLAGGGVQAGQQILVPAP